MPGLGYGAELRFSDLPWDSSAVDIATIPIAPKTLNANIEYQPCNQSNGADSWEAYYGETETKGECDAN